MKYFIVIKKEKKTIAYLIIDPMITPCFQQPHPLTSPLDLFSSIFDLIHPCFSFQTRTQMQMTPKSSPDTFSYLTSCQMSLLEYFSENSPSIQPKVPPSNCLQPTAGRTCMLREDRYPNILLKFLNADDK